ncbi:unnamed protein product, partial [Staurois parvus]
DCNVSGVPYAGQELNLFADDALLTLTNPLTTLPNLQQVLERFSLISGLCINLNKTVALNITLASDLVSRLQSHFPNKWASSSLEYLGIRLTPTYDSLFASNYYPLLRSVSSLMHSWQFPHLSWIGQINSVKMTILQLLYYFRTLQCGFLHFLRLLQAKIMHFIWADKCP